jgi:DNA mismatch repair ATPase MutS
MRAYWEVKAQNMNAVVLVEMGREYMAFENDAIRLH